MRISQRQRQRSRPSAGAPAPPGCSSRRPGRLAAMPACAGAPRTAPAGEVACWLGQWAAQRGSSAALCSSRARPGHQQQRRRPLRLPLNDATAPGQCVPLSHDGTANMQRVRVPVPTVAQRRGVPDDPCEAGTTVVGALPASGANAASHAAVHALQRRRTLHWSGSQVRLCAGRGPGLASLPQSRLRGWPPSLSQLVTAASCLLVCH
jgi:hypothetical protein